MQTQNVPELLGTVKEYGAHEDFNNAIDNNHDKIDFDRKWEHSRTKIGRMLSLDEQIEHEYENPDATTKLTTIEKQLGYKSHSAVTKRLAKMKEQFDEMMRQMKQ